MFPSTTTIPRLINVLLAEDSAADAALVMEAFKDSSKHIHVVRVNDGEQVMDYLWGRDGFSGGKVPDLVLLDLSMPRKNGFQVLGEIRSDPKLNAIPVVILTNSNLETDVRQAYEGSANYYLVKPPGVEDFFAAIRKVEDIWLGGINTEED
jgi:chemotaxis family two-component system response regulator Rcp1